LFTIPGVVPSVPVNPKEEEEDIEEEIDDLEDNDIEE
jgi:hypothetical protein